MAGLATAEAFAAAAGDGEATPVLGPAATGPPGEAVAAGLPGAFAGEPGEAPVAAVAGELPGEGERPERGGLAGVAEATAPEETAAPCGGGTCAAGGRRAFLFLWCARADVGQVLAHAHLSQEDRSFENVIARRAAAITPFSLDIGPRVIGAHLLAVTIDAAIGSVNARAARDHSRLRHWIDICAFLVRLRIEVSDLPIRDHSQSHPGERKCPEDSEKKRGESFH